MKRASGLILTQKTIDCWTVNRGTSRASVEKNDKRAWWRYLWTPASRALYLDDLPKPYVFNKTRWSQQSDWRRCDKVLSSRLDNLSPCLSEETMLEIKWVALGYTSCVRIDTSKLRGYSLNLRKLTHASLVKTKLSLTHKDSVNLYMHHGNSSPLPCWG